MAAGCEGRAPLGTSTVICSVGLRKTIFYLLDCPIVMDNQSADLSKKGRVCRAPFCKLLSVRLLWILPPQTSGAAAAAAGGRWGHIKETADESPNSEAEGRQGVFEGAQPLHQAPWGAAAVAAGGEWGHAKGDSAMLSPFAWPLGDLNPRPTDYESAALTN